MGADKKGQGSQDEKRKGVARRPGVAVERTEVDACIGWTCPHCKEYVYEADTLEYCGFEIDGKSVQSDNVDCPSCGKECFVYRYF